MARPLRDRQHPSRRSSVPPSLPASVKHLVVGAGVHGLSTAWHLAKAGEEVLVVDKTGVAAGASGIACGVVRNNYFQPAMSELMAACVEVWESDPDALHYHGSGYIALGPPSQESDLAEVFERHQRIGYPSELHTGEDAVREHMRSLYPDWRAPGLTVCLHEHGGGFAFNRESMLGLADKARAAGAQIVEGVEVTGFESDGSGAVRTVRTSAGDVAVEQVVVAVGPWIGSLWEMLELPRTLDVRTPDGTVAEGQEMWTYWYLQEGEVAVDPATFTTAAGEPSPVLHVDSDAGLRDDGGRLPGRPRAGRRGCCPSPATRGCAPGGGPSSRTSRGASTSSPTASPSRAAPSRSRRATSSTSTRTPPARSTPASRTCGAPRCRTASAASRACGRSTARCARAASARSRSTTSRSSTTCGRTSTSPRTRTTATR